MASAAAMPCHALCPWRCAVVSYFRGKGLIIHRGYGFPKRPSSSSLSSLENVAARTVHGARPLLWLTCPVERRLGSLGLFIRSRVSAASPRCLEHREEQRKSKRQSILDCMPVGMAWGICHVILHSSKVANGNKPAMVVISPCSTPQVRSRLEVRRSLSRSRPCFSSRDGQAPASRQGA